LNQLIIYKTCSSAHADHLMGSEKMEEIQAENSLHGMTNNLWSLLDLDQ